MQVKAEPLNDKELDVLEHFLLYRTFEQQDEIEEREFDKNFDEGVLCFSELDGFLTAIVSGPVTVMPSQWVPLLWGDEEPVYNSEKEFSTIMTLLIRHMNSIAKTLVETPEYFYPMFECRLVDDKEIFIVDEWCEGYMRAMSINKGLWLGHSDRHDDYIEVINSFTEDGGWIGQQNNEIINGEERAEVVWHAAYNIHQFWISQRTPNETVQYSKQKTGRNEPCPCGSGKKYKKCCLH